MQHVRRTVTYVEDNKEYVYKSLSLDFWEAFRVQPDGYPGPASGISAPGLNKSLVAAGINLDGLKAMDWFLFPTGHACDKVVYKGDVFYLDNMKELPKGWSKTAILASGGLPAIQNNGNEAAINDLLIKFFRIGPYRHDITVSDKVDYKDP